ncbi:GIY-YIG nuclease family protein [Brachybacterium halotolerans subsp. kimchii]|uniref:GIY-YIG nuclease family protein n=1 Tax=Brachybacterium halotolerans TaxID=2795215 RepID=UPI001E519B89|nr:GIY-YIG nuclease family protein [Brachybacterium halotolerans]UEJ82929.1 GIY-YIG nuclease family protein [Brachybacterium halotolerans subsp. kimchii]
MNGKQIRLFLTDGRPGGLMTAEIMNWTGHVLKGKRIDLGEIRTRTEATRTGIYILFGAGPDGDPLAYIGQSDDVAKRLANHDAKKDFWSEVVIVTSKDANLTSAHVRYLEARLVRLAQEKARVPLANVQEPTGGADLPEADASDMDYFIEQLSIIMPVLGYDIFRGRSHAPSQGPAFHAADEQPELDLASAAADSPEFRLQIKDIDARAQMIDGEFTVLQGSTVSARMRKGRSSHSESTARQFQNRAVQHAEMLKFVTVPEPDAAVGTLDRDMVFSSPSAAGAVVQGHASCNGRRSWIASDGRSYGAWEDQRAQV